MCVCVYMRKVNGNRSGKNEVYEFTCRKCNVTLDRVILRVFNYAMVTYTRVRDDNENIERITSVTKEGRKLNRILFNVQSKSIGFFLSQNLSKNRIPFFSKRKYIF